MLSMEWLRVALAGVVLVSCATAASDHDDGKVVPTVDSGSSFPDARPRPDAGATPDAAPVITFDAAPVTPDAGQGLFCESSDVCDSDECCLTLGGDTGFCVRGQEVLYVCLPD